MQELAPIKKSRVPTSKWTLYHAMRCILRECFGDFFKGTDEIVRMKDNFDFVSVQKMCMCIVTCFQIKIWDAFRSKVPIEKYKMVGLLNGPEKGTMWRLRMVKAVRMVRAVN